MKLELTKKEIKKIIRAIFMYDNDVALIEKLVNQVDEWEMFCNDYEN